MYLAKERGRNNFQFYAPELNASILSRLKLEMELREALAAQQFELYYQPKLAMPGARLCGAEALIRWRNSEGQLVPPNRFIPVAEECGLIGAIGDWVLAQACRQHAAWRAEGLPVPPLAVNVSARQFAQPGFADGMGRMLEELGMPPSAIELELTESMLMADVRRTAATLEQLKGLGFTIAIDDFGTGFSSLNYLRHFKLDVLKIDQSFVRELQQDRAALAIVQSIIALARALNLETVAEGVETEAQRAELERQGCGAMQGYLFAKPMPAAEFAERLRSLQRNDNLFWSHTTEISNS
jgi:EAL domain-containing protein (putative c-di-GMP-specific phosphodiesterase class I)